MSKQEIQQIKECAKRLAQLLEVRNISFSVPLGPMPELAEPGFGPTMTEVRWRQRGLDEAQQPVKVNYHREVLAILKDGWRPIERIYEDHVPQRLPALKSWRQEILDHTDPGRDPNLYWLEGGEEGFGPNPGLKDAIKNLESTLREDADRAEKALPLVTDRLAQADPDKPGQKPNGQRQLSGNNGAHATVIIQNSNVTMGDIHQTQNLATGNRSSIGKETSTGEKDKRSLKGTVAAIIAFLAQLWTCSGWLKPIRAFFHWLGL